MNNFLKLVGLSWKWSESIGIDIRKVPCKFGGRSMFRSPPGAMFATLLLDPRVSRKFANICDWSVTSLLQLDLNRNGAETSVKLWGGRSTNRLGPIQAKIHLPTPVMNKMNIFLKLVGLSWKWSGSIGIDIRRVPCKFCGRCMFRSPSGAMFATLWLDPKVSKKFANICDRSVTSLLQLHFGPKRVETGSRV